MIQKLSNDEKVYLMFDLISSFTNLKNPTEIANFLGDLLTANEIKNLSIRLRIAKLLLSGKSQRDITRETHASLGTVNKVNIWLNRGGDGFRKVVKGLPIKWPKPVKIPHGPLEFHLPELILAAGEYVVTNSQEGAPKKLISGVQQKERIDRQIRDANRDYYLKR